MVRDHGTGANRGPDWSPEDVAEDDYDDIDDITPSDFNDVDIDGSEDVSPDDEDGDEILFSDYEGVTDVDTSHLDEVDRDELGPLETIFDADNPECPVCGTRCNTERGVKSHFGQKHKDKEWEDYADEDDDDDDGDDNDDSDDAVNAEDTSSGQVILNEIDDDAIPVTPDEADGEGRIEEREQARKTLDVLWDDARRAYEMASINGTDVTRREALSTALKPLERETKWMSIRERSSERAHDLWRWVDGEGWQDDGFSFVAKRMDDELDTDADKRTVKKAVHHLAVRNKVYQASLNAAEFDATLIPVGNGVIDIDNVEYDPATMTIDLSSVTLEAMKPEHRFTYCIDTDWDPENADLDGLDAWVEKIVDTDDDVRTVWEFAGHSLHPRYPVDGFLVAVGKGGSGKSMLLKVIKAMLGDTDISTMSIKQIETERFAKRHVADARANINTELNGTKIQSLDQLKTLSAGEEVFVEKKGEPGYFTKSDATMIFASDNPPALPNRNDALRRRIYPVEFPGQFVPNPDSSNPYEFQRRPKETVESELQAQDRLKAALVRAVEGLARLVNEGDFTTELSREERLDRYESFADPARHFAQHCLEDAGPDSKIESGVFQATVDAFCAAQDHSAKSMKQICKVLDDMTSLSYDKGRTRSWADDKTMHTIYSGLRFSAEALKNFVPEHAVEAERIDLSALREAEEDDTRPSAIDEHDNDGDDDDGEGGVGETVNDDGGDEGEDVRDAAGSDGAQKPQNNAESDTDAERSDAQVIDRAAVQHASDAESVGELAGRVSAATQCNDLDRIKHRVRTLRESGDIILEGNEVVNPNDGEVGELRAAIINTAPRVESLEDLAEQVAARTDYDDKDLIRRAAGLGNTHYKEEIAELLTGQDVMSPEDVISDVVEETGTSADAVVETLTTLMMRGEVDPVDGGLSLADGGDE